MKGLCPECETFHKADEACPVTRHFEQQLWQPIEYGENAGHIELPKGSPFDGSPVLIRTNIGIVEARWMDWESHPTLEDPNDGDGWQWICYDDEFTCELDEALNWMPRPEPPKDAGT